jgi:dienelactone hydrolase
MKYLSRLLTFSLLSVIALSTNAQSLNEDIAGRLESFKLVKAFSSESLKAFFKEREIPKLFLPAKNGVNVYEVVYTTTFVNGAVVKASGFLYVPEADIKSHPTLIYNHGTDLCHENYFHGKGEQSICLAFATDGYIVLCPDYVGINKGEMHQLYLHAATEAAASVDMLHAIEPLLESFGVERSGQLFTSGYSQGGHASMATHKLIQEKYADHFKVTAASPMSGPYNLSKTVYDGRNDKYDYPGFLMFLLYTYFGSMGNPDAMATVLKAPYDSIIPPMMFGNWPIEEVNTFLPDTAFRVVKDDFLKEFEENPNSNFRKYLESNNVYDWKPDAPVQLCYCEGDRKVPYMNSYAAEQAMTKNGAKEIILLSAGKKFDHINCALFAVIYTKMFFDDFVKYEAAKNRQLVRRVVLNIGKLTVEP